jgi:hypothetical protein
MARDTSGKIGDAILGPEREARHMRAMAGFVGACAWNNLDERAVGVLGRFVASFEDALEAKIEKASGAKKRDLLEMYDMLTELRERFASTAPDKQKPGEWIWCDL